MPADHFSLQDKYLKEEGAVALTGIQALVRLPMERYRRDKAAGLRVGTYISGYQGSPLGELDKQLRLAGPLLDRHHIRFEPGINEDVAATAIYGSQMLDLFPHERYDGVTGIWYGKAPGVDRSGDAFRHGQYIGTSKHGGVLMLAGDDPAAKSSTLPCDSTVALYDTFFPMLYPGNAQEVLEFGLHGLAMSRYSGLFSAMKIVTNVADGGGIVEVSPELARSVLPELEIGGKPFEKRQLTMLIPPFTLECERQIYYERMAAARAYARANKLDRIVVRSGNDRIGLISMGKSHLDLLLALELLGLDEAALKHAGVRLYKLGMISPVEPLGLAEFARGLDEIVMVEEKRGFVEMQVRDALYNLPGRPAVYGKQGPDGQPLFAMHGELQPDQIARLLADFLADRLKRPDLRERVKWLAEIQERKYEEIMPRTPYFCSGCPHNTSTTLPEGEVTGGGIGCHAMAAYMNRGVMWLTHMGGEGAPWMGLRHFTEKPHIFQNVGDGTYFHSASKSVEATIAANAHMTYKILYNSAVAMTGGQQVWGGLSQLDMARQLEAEGMQRIVIVAEDATRYPEHTLSERISVRPREDYNQVMLELKDVPGVTAIIFDQQCAAEKRRQRKRGILAAPRKRVFINEGVCEGCGDCGVKSNCLSVVPLETEFGRKRAIEQSSCNKDMSCVNGFCPSFVTIHGGALRKPEKLKASEDGWADLPVPAIPALDRPYGILVTGVGGTGVVTIGALLGMAAHLEGKGCSVLDMAGLAQKGGAVVSHIRLAAKPEDIHAVRVAAGGARLVLGCDLVVAASFDGLAKMERGSTRAVINSHETTTGDFTRNPDLQFPSRAMIDAIAGAIGKDAADFVDATRLATALLGDSIATNPFMLGFAWQRGLVPLAEASILRAIELNAVAVEANKQAFRWGRRAAHDLAAVERAAAPVTPLAMAKPDIAQTLEQAVERRI
ncbi:MAG: indolepyruvate ferredoxin oxidoreductase family protein, partial [Candidatus Lambdaproteobacteria bacterium]|nr:indolepyruvate ferredoxin oxidoreductase family protein [Candidatus Lambdaproteobacteria bacterium]